MDKNKKNAFKLFSTKKGPKEQVIQAKEYFLILDDSGVATGEVEESLEYCNFLCNVLFTFFLQDELENISDTESYIIINPTQKQAKAIEELTKIMESLKTLLSGTSETEPKKQDVIDIATQAYQTDLLLWIVKKLSLMEFEARKNGAQIFNTLLKFQATAGKYQTVEFILTKHPEILSILVRGYEKSDIALLCGGMLRECLKHEALAKQILYSEDLYRFFKYVDMSNFEVASDAFSTFKDLLTKHKSVCSEFLDKNFDVFFDEYKKLLKANNYVTKRQSIKLLGELLLDRSNFNIMTRFINMDENLKLMMNLLLEKSRNIQFEAFHVFKVFVANPNKAKQIKDILSMNKEKLMQYLSTFHVDRDEQDEQFAEEKKILLQEIEKM